MLGSPVQVATKLDYAALEKKLEQLTQRAPPRKRKTVADVLEPLRDRLVAPALLTFPKVLGYVHKCLLHYAIWSLFNVLNTLVTTTGCNHYFNAGHYMY